MNASFLHRAWICLIVVSPAIIGGITTGFSSIAIPEMNLSLSASSWFSCLFSIAAPFGSLAAGYVIDKFGRKPALIQSTIPGLIGWLLIAYHGNKLWPLFLGRFLNGLSSGATFFPGQIYLAEFIDLDPKLFAYRSSFTCAIPIGTNLGFFLVIIFGAFLNYKTVAFIGLLFAIWALICICIFIPESPIWLYQKGRYGDAEWSQKRLKLSCSFENYPLGSTVDKSNRSSILSRLKRRDVYVPFFIACVYLPTLYLSGLGVLQSYMVNMIDPESSYSMQDSYNLSAIAATLLLVSSIGVLFAVPFVGVRKIAIGSSLLMTIGMLTYGISNYFTSSVYADVAHTFGIASVWVMQFSIGAGFNTIPRAALGEIFPPDANGFAAVPSILMYIVLTVTVKIHPYLAISLDGFAYIVYAMFSMILSIFLFKFLPETVGKTVSQINNDFNVKQTSL